MTTIRFNQPELEDMFRNPQGPIGRDLSRRAINVESQAKVNASGRPGPRVDTGRLRSSITHEVVVDANGLVARIGTNVEYARPLETGLRNGARYPFLEPALSAAAL